ncbi:hypothetical protein Vafri_20969 [Volvox africanus]|uniref:Uncharacterized protein n=1 Tax=Volvox africanus TaxID=51714 RepID=A0A8J4BRU9_9CHLO|nr:hypothetical protein Vafri_20969 [Volvox africanus]
MDIAAEADMAAATAGGPVVGVQDTFTAALLPDAAFVCCGCITPSMLLPPVAPSWVSPIAEVPLGRINAAPPAAPVHGAPLVVTAALPEAMAAEDAAASDGTAGEIDGSQPIKFAKAGR